jgi:hypothetical protein
LASAVAHPLYRWRREAINYRRSVFKALKPNGDAVHSDETAR